MSIYMKNEQGEIKKVGGSVIQRWNDRIFRTSHEIFTFADYYEIEEAASKFILSFTPYTEYQLYIDQPNTSSEVYITFKNRFLLLRRSSGEEIIPGSLFGKVHCYTLDLENNEIWTDDSVELQLVKSDIADLKVKTTSIYTFKGSRTFETLPITGMVIGDTYNITNSFVINDHVYLAGTNVAWKSDGWDPLASPLPNAGQIKYEGTVPADYVGEAINVLAGELVLDSITTIVTKTLTDKLDITYTGNLTSITVTIPHCEHGYYSGINFKTQGSVIPFNIVNNSNKPLLIIDGGVIVPNVVILPNKTYNLAFHCDGLNVYCYYIYLGV